MFVAQLTRDLVAREAAGAALLTPGAKRWRDALQSFVKEVADTTGGPDQSRRGVQGRHQAPWARTASAGMFCQQPHDRSRSGGFELLTWEVAKHPLIKTGYDGVLVHGYICSLQRGGCVSVARTRLRLLLLARARAHTRAQLIGPV